MLAMSRADASCTAPLTACFIALIDSGALSAIVRARSYTVSFNSSSVTTRFTSPIRCASSASIRSPV